MSGRWRHWPTSWWRPLAGPKPDPQLFESDGCSGGAPDTYRTWTGKEYELWPACFIHDYHYRYDVLNDTGALGRKFADDALRVNIVRCIKLQGGRRWTQRRISWLYWGRVRVWGASSWRHWAEGDEPLSFSARMREAWTRG